MMLIPLTLVGAALWPVFWPLWLLRRAGQFIVGVLLVCALLLVAPPAPASAHDFWINQGGYKSPADGTHCCGKNDCQVVRADGVRVTSEGYLLTDGATVPFAETLRSEDGDYWMCTRHDGSRRCFFAPDMGS